MREAEEDHVVAGQHLGRGLLERAPGQRHEVRLEAAEEGAGVGAAGQRADLDLGMGQQQPEDLAPGVPARPGDGDRDSHVHNHTDICMEWITGFRVSAPPPRLTP